MTATPAARRTNRRSKLRPAKRRLMLESLERRELLAGDVSISVSDARVTEGDQATTYLDAFVPTGNGGLDGTRAIAFNSQGEAFVISLQTNAVLRYSAAGTFLGAFVPPGSDGLYQPFDLKFGPDHNLYVSSFSSLNTVFRYDGSTGQFLDKFIVPGDGGLSSPTGILFDSAGDLLVSSYDTGTILKYRGPNNSLPDHPAGEFLGQFADAGLNSSPDYMTFGPDGRLYVTCPGHLSPPDHDATVKRFDGQTGAFIDTFVPVGSGGLADNRGILFDSQGNLLVADTYQNAVLRYQGPGAALPGAYIDAVVPPGAGGVNKPIGITLGPDGNLYVGSRDSDSVLRFGNASQMAFTISLSAPTIESVSVSYAIAAGTAGATDFVGRSGAITFAPGETSHTILVKTLDDTTYEGNETFTVNLSNPIGAAIADGQGVGTIVDNDIAPTKFYVADDGSANKTFEYAASGASVENYGINSGNTAPRGAASTAAGDKVWVVDANKHVYVYDTSGGLVGSWSAGSLPSNADLQGITVSGADVWIVDAKADKVYKYAGAASRLSGSQNAASSFNLNSGNTSPTDLVTDGASIWVLNNSSTDKVFKYSIGGSLLGSWTITGGGGSPTGITIDPTHVSNIWIVDNASDRVYQFDAAASRTSGSQAPSTSFALAAGDTNPQGIADPPPGASSTSAYDSALLAVIGDLDDVLGAGKKRK